MVHILPLLLLNWNHISYRNFTVKRIPHFPHNLYGILPIHNHFLIQCFQPVLITSSQADHIERFFHWLHPPDHLTSKELEMLALQKGIHLLGSHRFAMQNKNKSSYVQVSIASPDTDENLRKGLLILKNIFEEKQLNFFV